MSKILEIILIFLLLSNCSLDKKTGLWNENKNIEKEKNLVINELFKEQKAFNKEFNNNVKIKIKSNKIKNNFIGNLDNNNKQSRYDGNLESIFKFKFSKIDNFNQFDLEILVDDSNNTFFFDNKGSIFKIDESSKTIWKKNYYIKTEKKLNPILFFSKSKSSLIIVDNIAKYYAVDLDTGELLWAKRNSAPFNSQVKLYKDKFFVIDFQNILRCFSVNDGKELWNVKTDDTFIKSQKKLSLAISNKTIFFNNSVGDISAVDIESERLIWQTPTQSSSIYENAFLLETSDLVIENDSIYFSNNRNEFYSLDSKTGGINWVQKINSNVRPTVIDNFVFTVTIEGFLVIIEKNSGNIIRITDIFEKIKNKKRESVNPVGFVVGLNNIYLTTNNGLFIVVDIFSGKTSSITKIGNKKILRPFVVDDKIIITKNNAIIRFK